MAAEIRTGIGETLWLDPKVPVIKIRKELGTNHQVVDREQRTRSVAAEKPQLKRGHP